MSDMKSVALTTDKLVGVIGAGTMGAGIAMTAALAGHPVKMFDADSTACLRGVSGIQKELVKLAERGKITPEEATRAHEKLEAADQLSDLKEATLIVEAIIENREIKQELFCALENIVSTDCILASNTSSISISRLASILRHPGRFAGMHFFNPVYRMQLVEVIEGLETRPDVSATIFETALAWGKRPVYAKSTPGFIVNRVARPYYAESLRLLTEGAADAVTIDAIMHDCAGFRMGPFELMDLIGNDVNFAVTKSIFEAFYFDPRFTPSLMQQELVDAGYFGRKTGKGFHSYSENAPARIPKTEIARVLPGVLALQKSSSLGAALVTRLPETVIVEDLTGDRDGLVMKVDDTFVYCTDGRTAIERACANGEKNVVLFDACLDYAESPRIVVTKASSCTEDALSKVIGLLQKANYAVTRVEDVAGMVVMRTVCMLANEAFELVNQQVCSEEAVDVAMQLGMNYPLGPIGWASLLGTEALYAVLKNLGQHYGEDRYRVSPKISSKHWVECARRSSGPTQ